MAFPGHRPPAPAEASAGSARIRTRPAAPPSPAVRCLVKPGEGSEQVFFLPNLEVGSGYLPALEFGPAAGSARRLGKRPGREPGEPRKSHRRVPPPGRHFGAGCPGGGGGAPSHPPGRQVMSPDTSGSIVGEGVMGENTARRGFLWEGFIRGACF